MTKVYELCMVDVSVLPAPPIVDRGRFSVSLEALKSTVDRHESVNWVNVGKIWYGIIDWRCVVIREIEIDGEW